MIFLDSAQMIVELHMPCSKSEYYGLFFSLELVYLVFWIEPAHVTVHRSTCCVACPVIKPLLLDV